MRAGSTGLFWTQSEAIANRHSAVNCPLRRRRLGTAKKHASSKTNSCPRRLLAVPIF